MDAMTILGWIIVGGVAGLLASALVRGGGMGVIGDIIVGIVGAFIGGFIMNALGHAGATGFNLWSVFVAFVGAVVLLALVRLFAGNRGSTTV
jgi:uncharacterized membrane protein YeaQ/YmgE (transglycosylase-associated protein family)